MSCRSAESDKEKAMIEVEHWVPTKQEAWESQPNVIGAYGVCRFCMATAPEHCDCYCRKCDRVVLGDCPVCYPMTDEDADDPLSDSLGIPRSCRQANVVATAPGGKFARADIALAKLSVMTAPRTSCGGGSRNPGAAVCGQVVTAFLPAGIARAGMDAMRSSGAIRMHRCKRCLVSPDG